MITDSSTSEDVLEAPKPEPVKRANCTGCNHSESFHRSGGCKVMACICKEWNGPVVPRKTKK